MISEGIRKPGSYTEIIHGVAGGLPSKTQDVLIIGEADSAPANGEGAYNVPTRVYSAKQAAEFWGEESVIHKMVRAAYRQYPQCSLYGAALPAPAPDAAPYAPVYDNAAGQRFHIIAIQGDTLAHARELAEHLDTVSSEINQMAGRGFMFIRGVSLAAAATLGKAVNDKRICIGFIPGVSVYRYPYEDAAAFAAMQAAQPAPWLATNNVELVGCPAPDIPDRLAFNEINSLLHSGIAPFMVGAGERVRCVRAISTYVQNDAGADDDAFLDSFKIATADYVREAIRTRHLNDFQNKVLRDNHVPGEPPGVVTPADVRSTNLDVCRRIEREGGLNDVNFFADKFVSTRNPNVPGRVDSEIPVDIVDAAHIMANTIIISSTL